LPFIGGLAYLLEKKEAVMKKISLILLCLSLLGIVPVTTVKADLGTDLDALLGKARIRVKVTDIPGGDGIPGSEVNITDAPIGVECDCVLPVTTDASGEVILTLTGVPETEAVEIEVEVSGVPGYSPKSETIYVVAFATVDLEIVLTPEFLLQVTKSGTGGGTVNSSPAGISCGTDCTENYIEGTVVSLTAQADTNSNFTGWSGGGCSGTGDCNVSMNQSHTVNATFQEAQAGNIRPTISNPAWSLDLLNDSSCALSLPVGSSFLITFDHSDPDGNGPKNISEAKINIAWLFPDGGDGSFANYTWNSSLSGDGYSGTATTKQCYRFGSNSYVDVTMTIEDLPGSRSNPLTVRIDKPSVLEPELCIPAILHLLFD
jgi:hypothetical protein